MDSAREGTVERVVGWSALRLIESRDTSIRRSFSRIAKWMP
ncbi:Uncharacterized protein pbN1_07480 [Aromatoleum bremense]|nr:Uncharacterized protein pbN1_07480 [Aromatoleum bremense]